MPGDVEAIEEDLEELKALFNADGDGLDASVIRALCDPVGDLLTVLQLDTSILIDNLKQARSGFNLKNLVMLFWCYRVGDLDRTVSYG